MSRAIRWTEEQRQAYEAKLGRPLKRAKPVEEREKAVEQRKSKHNNKKCEFNGMQFDSHRELSRYTQLLTDLRMGSIRDLHRQVTFVLAPAVHIESNKRKTPALRYVADFIYVEDGRLIVEDVKGMKTRAYLQKKHLMKTIHGIDIKET